MTKDNTLQRFKSFIFDREPSRIKPIKALENNLNRRTCLSTVPYDHHPLMHDVSRAVKSMAINASPDIEEFTVIPRFSGLKGPKITLMRSDLERVFVNNQGSAAEIYHNATFTASNDSPCDKPLSLSHSFELNHQIDAYDSDRAPLVQSRARVNTHINFGGYFMGTMSLGLPLYDNLEREKDLRILTSPDPIRQDTIGFAWQGFSVDRLMLSGFATPKPDLYVGAHVGYLDPMFFGLGGEMLYRPYKSVFAAGVEAWSTSKRIPYLGNIFGVEESNQQVSALANFWYDMPDTPLTFGVSAGRFLDGDYGGQIKTIYQPASGWKVEGYATYSNESDRTLDGGETHWIGGMRLSMPLGQFKFIPDNSRQTITVEPFARDKGQRIDNALPLYDLTDRWQANNVHRYWGKIGR